jgi:hypothetical protein
MDVKITAGKSCVKHNSKANNDTSADHYTVGSKRVSQHFKRELACTREIHDNSASF